MSNSHEMANFIWSVADLLRGDYKQADYGKVILPFTVLRRLDSVLKPTKQQVLEQVEKLKKMNVENLEPVLNRVTGYEFHNTSKFDFESLLADQDNLAANLVSYINAFSTNAKDIMDYFNFATQIEQLDKSNLLYQVMQKFATVNLHPDYITNVEMGYIFEELIRKFAEQSNETAGEHFTPREVIRLMTNLVFNEDQTRDLTKEGIVRTIYDPACGTGGMLSVSEEYIAELNPDAKIRVFGQEINPESYAICKSDMLLKGHQPSQIKFGNSFSQDQLSDTHFDYMLSNPPFGVEWKKVQKEIRDEAERLGYNGRFGAGLPRISDGSLLFLQHMLSKMKPVSLNGSRLAIVFNGSPLFSGGAESGESNIRRWIIENDWLEAIIGLPDQLFYNTGISTYIWVLTNRKADERKGKIQLINATHLYRKMRKSLGNKRNELSADDIKEITRMHGEFQETKRSKIFDNEDFGFRRITVEQPLRLNFLVSDERIDCLKQEKAFQNLAATKKKGAAGEAEIEAGKQQQKSILAVLEGMRSEKLYKNREEFVKELKKQFKDSGLKIAATLQKTILSALSERDETADICVDSKGNPEPDADLRDYENVPLKEDIHEYFEREVKPFVPDAWIDEDKMKIGYEIPFTRHFYEYIQMRPLAEIESEIQELELGIAKVINQTFGWANA
ncbi:class I SAM-dependent DNA methyltransferase [Alicyclobacillus sp. SO9]|uniref:type I restriction-modification system subunit M n=1 Tax=Alicyclobacillus sp. SO9 TaxID=2665646 RepID=UPI0018E6F64B|nr:class I SAM-dependent DNA methyltransferase [Alicyclobacillus sp. SO9]QQE80429.1 SAM-dependent DNA methyltransferase [Alicyclobacillus sp. SO9]